MAAGVEMGMSGESAPRLPEELGAARSLGLPALLLPGIPLTCWELGTLSTMTRNVVHGCATCSRVAWEHRDLHFSPAFVFGTHLSLPAAAFMAGLVWLFVLGPFSHCLCPHRLPRPAALCVGALCRWKQTPGEQQAQAPSAWTLQADSPPALILCRCRTRGGPPASLSEVPTLYGGSTTVQVPSCPP